MNLGTCIPYMLRRTYSNFGLERLSQLRQALGARLGNLDQKLTHDD